jgi:hypothetical protein
MCVRVRARVPLVQNLDVALGDEVVDALRLLGRQLGVQGVPQLCQGGDGQRQGQTETE